MGRYSGFYGEHKDDGINEVQLGHLFTELTNIDSWNSFVDNGMQHCPWELGELYKLLIERVDQIAQDALTPKQLKYWTLRRQGFTYEQIAEICNVRYTSPYYGLNPQKQRLKDGTLTTWGGAYRKLRNLCYRDEIAVAILEEIAKYSDGGEYDESTYR